MIGDTQQPATSGGGVSRTNKKVITFASAESRLQLLSNLAGDINNNSAGSVGGSSSSSRLPSESNVAVGVLGATSSFPTNRNMSAGSVGGSSSSSRLPSGSNVAVDVRGATGSVPTNRHMSVGIVGGSSSSSRLPSVSNVVVEVRGATGSVPTNRNMSSGNGDVASSTNTPQKEDIIILKIKDIVLDDRNNVSHIGLYPIKRITLNNVRFFMSANSIKLNSKTKNVTWWKGLLTQKLNTIGVRARCYQRTLGQSRPLLQLTTLSLE